jgi:hypothetical protein
MGNTDSIISSANVILALSRRQHHHYAPIAKAMPLPVVETDDWRPEVVRSVRPRILLTLCSDWWEADLCIRQARELGIPTVQIMDGIIEWRHQWEDPKTGNRYGAPLYQPVVVDKLACLGRQSVRLLEFWGNIGKCELVGCPRMDVYLTNPVPPPPNESPKRLLVMTANNPGFTTEQVRAVKQALLDLRNALAERTDWLPIWRVSPHLRQELDLRDDFPSLRHAPLYEVLGYAHAVITTPSTAQLEAMLACRPVSLLDYTNSPHYVEAAWTISCAEHIHNVLESLGSPPPTRMLHQDYILHDCLECQTPATPRMVQLLKALLEQPSFSPHRVLLPRPDLSLQPTQVLNLSQLYPGNELLSEVDLVDLKRRLIFAQQEIRWLRRMVSVTGPIKRAVRKLTNLAQDGLKRLIRMLSSERIGVSHNS